MALVDKESRRFERIRMADAKIPAVLMADCSLHTPATDTGIALDSQSDGSNAAALRKQQPELRNQLPTLNGTFFGEDFRLSLVGRKRLDFMSHIYTLDSLLYQILNRIVRVVS